MEEELIKDELLKSEPANKDKKREYRRKDEPLKSEPAKEVALRRSYQSNTDNLKQEV